MSESPPNMNSCQQSPQKVAAAFALAVTKPSHKGRRISKSGTSSIFEAFYQCFPKLCQQGSRRRPRRGRIGQPEFNKLLYSICGFTFVRSRTKLVSRENGHWFVSGRRWLNPADANDKKALDSALDMLTSEFEEFQTCDRAQLFRILVDMYTAWSQSAGNGQRPTRRLLTEVTPGPDTDSVRVTSAPLGFEKNWTVSGRPIPRSEISIADVGNARQDLSEHMTSDIQEPPDLLAPMPPMQAMGKRGNGKGLLFAADPADSAQSDQARQQLLDPQQRHDEASCGLIIFSSQAQNIPDAASTATSTAPFLSKQACHMPLFHSANQRLTGSESDDPRYRCETTVSLVNEPSHVLGYGYAKGRPGYGIESGPAAIILPLHRDCNGNQELASPPRGDARMLNDGNEGHGTRSNGDRSRPGPIGESLVSQARCHTPNLKLPACVRLEVAGGPVATAEMTGLRGEKEIGLNAGQRVDLTLMVLAAQGGVVDAAEIENFARSRSE